MTRLVLAGDVMLGRGVNDSLPFLTPSEVWGDLLPDFHAADVRFVNLECAVTEHSTPWKKYEKAFYFRADPLAVEVLRAARIDAVSLANNHTLDFEEAGLLDTVRYLDRAGIAHAGAGKTLHEAREPAIVNGFALLAMTDNEPGFAADKDKPGTNYFPTDLDIATLDWIARAASDARQRGAQIVVLSNHWGPNMVQRPSSLFRRFAQAAIERGVDVYFGHSAHVFQGIEFHEGKPIFYDTGDFLDDYAVDPDLRNDWSFLFVLDFDGSRLMRIELVPVSLEYARVRRAVGDARREILARMKGLSIEFGTRLEEHSGRLTWERRLKALVG